MGLKHYIRFDLANFKVEASGAWFGVTCLCYAAVAFAIVGAILRAVF